MIDVEKHALRPFKQDALALALHFIEQRPHGIGVGQDFGCDLAELLEEVRSQDFSLAKAAPQRIVMRQQALDLGSED